jgi:hypothetical protein
MKQQPSQPFARGTRRAVLALLLLALGTIFLPLLTSTPAANGRTEWAAIDFVAQMAAGALPLKRGIYTLAPLWLTYAALVLTPLVILLPQYHKPIAIIALGGLIFSVRTVGADSKFNFVLRALKHAPGTGVDFQIAFHPTAYILPVLLALVLLVLSNERFVESS